MSVTNEIIAGILPKAGDITTFLFTLVGFGLFLVFYFVWKKRMKDKELYAATVFEAIGDSFRTYGGTVVFNRKPGHESWTIKGIPIAIDQSYAILQKNGKARFFIQKAGNTYLPIRIVKDALTLNDSGEVKVIPGNAFQSVTQIDALKRAAVKALQEDTKKIKLNDKFVQIAQIVATVLPLILVIFGTFIIWQKIAAVSDTMAKVATIFGENSAGITTMLGRIADALERIYPANIIPPG